MRPAHGHVAACGDQGGRPAERGDVDPPAAGLRGERPRQVAGGDRPALGHQADGAGDAGCIDVAGAGRGVDDPDAGRDRDLEARLEPAHRGRGTGQRSTELHQVPRAAGADLHPVEAAAGLGHVGSRGAQEDAIAERRPWRGAQDHRAELRVDRTRATVAWTVPLICGPG